MNGGGKWGGAWTIGSFHGVKFNIHFSLIFLLLYIILVATAQFSMVAKRVGIDPLILSFSPIIWGGIFAICLFVSIALHELGHALTAQAFGVKITGITLMMLGGVSEMERMPDKKYAEFKLAIAGPIVSLVIGGLLLFIHSNQISANVSFFSYWLRSEERR